MIMTGIYLQTFLVPQYIYIYIYDCPRPFVMPNNHMLMLFILLFYKMHADYISDSCSCTLPNKPDYPKNTYLNIS